MSWGRKRPGRGKAATRNAISRETRHAHCSRSDFRRDRIVARVERGLVAADAAGQGRRSGSRGRRSLSRAILGSVSRTLMQETQRPVAVVHKATKKQGQAPA